MSELPEGWEAWLAFFAASLPHPVQQVAGEDGTVTFRAGDPPEVIVHLAPSLITVSMFSIVWARPDQPLVVARPVGYVRWRRLDAEHGTRVIETLVDAARAARRATFLTCEACERSVPPEGMFDARVCDACAARDHGRVH
jgi:hypothetical protein